MVTVPSSAVAFLAGIFGLAFERGEFGEAIVSSSSPSLSLANSGSISTSSFTMIFRVDRRGVDSAFCGRVFGGDVADFEVTALSVLGENSTASRFLLRVVDVSSLGATEPVFGVVKASSISLGELG